MNIIIIKYCINLIEKKQAVSNSIDLDIKDQNSIRLFCRYMLADHWEKNQNKNLKFDDPNKEEELCIFTLKEFLKLHKYYQNSKDEDSKNKFKSLFDESKELVEKRHPFIRCLFIVHQNKKPTTTWVAGYIMETAGFEPASRGPDTNLSTCVVY